MVRLLTKAHLVLYSLRRRKVASALCAKRQALKEGQG